MSENPQTPAARRFLRPNVRHMSRVLLDVELTINHSYGRQQ